MEKILIIGNGFDVNLGLNTSYTSFLSSDQFNGLLKSNNNLAKYLQAKQDAQLWVDVEHELKNYASGVSGESALFDEYLISQAYKIDGNSSAYKREVFWGIYSKDLLTERRLSLKSDFKFEFVLLKEALSNFLLDEFKKIKKEGVSKTNAYRLLKYGSLFDEKHSYLDFNFTKEPENAPFEQVFTFNYTNPLASFGWDKHYRIEPHFIHGSLSQNNIVFGVEDNSAPDDCAYLLKSEHAAFGKAPDLLSCLFGEVKSFHFFGCSLGDTDNAHFGEFFLFLAKNNNELAREPSKHQLFFYVYGKEGYQQIRNRISRLTNGQMARFKLNNDVVFYDIKDNKVVDQTYLNQI